MARSPIIPGINDLATLRADLDDLKQNAKLYPTEIRDCEAEIARQEAELAPASALVEDIKAGEFVKRKADANKVYKRGGYDRASKRYELLDCDDISRAIYVRKGTRLFIGFTY